MTDLAELPAVSVPMPWQVAAWEQLHQQIQSDQLPHAILIAGMADTGKNRMALALARLLLCHTPEAGHNCGNCHACQMSKAGSHGDFRWLEPQGKSRVIKVDQIREVVTFGTKTASLGQRKVIVFFACRKHECECCQCPFEISGRAGTRYLLDTRESSPAWIAGNHSFALPADAAATADANSEH